MSMLTPSEVARANAYANNTEELCKEMLPLLLDNFKEYTSSDPDSRASLSPLAVLLSEAAARIQALKTLHLTIAQEAVAKHEPEAAYAWACDYGKLEAIGQLIDSCLLSM